MQYRDSNLQVITKIHKYKRWSEGHDICLPKFGSLPRIDVSVEEATGGKKRQALPDHEGLTSRSLFQLLFLVVVDDFLQRSRAGTNFRGTPQSLGCSPATPSHLGPKNPRVINANHENRQYAQVLKVACSLKLNLTQIHTLILQIGSPLTKKGFEGVRTAQKIATESVE